MNNPLTAYELSPAAPGTHDTWLTGEWYEALCVRWNEAVDLFIKGQWAEAKDRFEESFTDDPAAQCFLLYMGRTGGVPPANWDGAFTPRAPE